MLVASAEQVVLLGGHLGKGLFGDGSQDLFRIVRHSPAAGERGPVKCAE